MHFGVGSRPNILSFYQNRSIIPRNGVIWIGKPERTSLRGLGPAEFAVPDESFLLRVLLALCERVGNLRDDLFQPASYVKSFIGAHDQHGTIGAV